MSEASDLYRSLLDALTAWPGYGGLSRLLESFPDFEVHLAGGVVRDLILGRGANPKDFDFFVRGASLEPALAMLAESGRMDRGPFGSPRWFPGALPEVYCDVIPIRRFVNGLWPCEDIVDTLNQFDFSGNAVAFNVRDGRFFDPQNGRRDLARRVMRAVRFDYPDEPIAPGQFLRRPVVLWFRILHYAQVLGLEIEPVTLRWLREHRAFRSLHEQFAATFFDPHSDAFRPIDG